MTTDGISPAHGDWMLKMSVDSSAIGQTVVVPADATTLKFSYRYENPTAVCSVDSIEFYDGALDIHESILLCSPNYVAAWRTVSIDVTAYRGTSRDLQFTVFFQPGTIVYLDDVGFVTSADQVVDYY